MYHVFVRQQLLVSSNDEEGEDNIIEQSSQPLTGNYAI